MALPRKPRVGHVVSECETVCQSMLVDSAPLFWTSCTRKPIRAALQRTSSTFNNFQVASASRIAENGTTPEVRNIKGPAALILIALGTCSGHKLQLPRGLHGRAHSALSLYCSSYVVLALHVLPPSFHSSLSSLATYPTTAETRQRHP